MNYAEVDYLNLLQDILDNGEKQEDRTGVGTLSINGRMLKFDMRQGFPALTTKKLAWKSVVGELLWFLEGSTDERRLCEITHGTRDPAKKTIWTANYTAPSWLSTQPVPADNEWNLGPVYGHQWRSWGKDDVDDFNGVDQLGETIWQLKHNPLSRRHIISLWNPYDVDRSALPPCHILHQFHVSNGFLDLTMYQRSCDVFLGVPFNIASYALYLHIIAKECNLTPRFFNHMMGDVHIYSNHIEQVKEQMTRFPYDLPTLQIADKSLFDERGNINYNVDDFTLVNYQHHPAIKAEMAV